MSTRYCPTCRDERPVEQPPCIDGHAECPEWMCLDCGHAFVGGWLEIDEHVPVSASLTSAA